jgi:hypothetical protein
MALNLWKVGGKPTSYNPLPTGFGTVIVLGIGEYVLNIKAKSATNSVLRVINGGVANDVNLTPISTTYTVLFSRKSTDNVFLYDNASKGDIIIDSIELVQKPLPKLTINGIDGFLSGKWSLHPNVTVVDDETLVLNATAGSQVSLVYFIVNPNTTYTFSMYREGRIRLGEFNSSDALVGSFLYDDTSDASGNIVKSFTTSSTTAKIRIELTGYTSAKYTFKRPMLNLGSTPAPYEKKRGDKMVLPVAKKNLFSGFLVGYINATLTTGLTSTNDSNYRTSNKFSVIGGKSYVISGANFNRNIFRFYDSTGNYLTDITANPVIAPNGSYFAQVFYANKNVDSTAGEGNFQIEEGSTASAYTPYSVQVNKKPSRLVPKKNLVNSNDIVWRSSFNANYSVVDTRVTGTIAENNVIGYRVPVTPGKTYTIRFNGTGGNTGGWRLYGYTNKPDYSYTDGTSNGFTSYSVLPGSPSINTITIGANNNWLIVGFHGGNVLGSFMEYVQMEEGTTLTAYEPYQLVLPKAKTGLAFDGVKDYLQLPSMTMDSIEIDCLIDSVQKAGNTYLFDGRNGSEFWLSGSARGSSVSKILLNGADTNINDFTTIPKNQRVKLKFISSTSFTDDVTIFQIFDKNAFPNRETKGIIYKVTCYLAGQVVAQYDFTNPANIVGDKVIPNAKNLIPSFEDSRWSLHANAKVLGKDVLRLDATGSWQFSEVALNVTPNMKHKITLNVPTGANGYIEVFVNSSGSWVSAWSSYNTTGFEFTPTTNQIRFRVGSNQSGSFDFIKPQLYQLDGKEGTIVGSPIPLNKRAKRSLYAKR